MREMEFSLWILGITVVGLVAVLSRVDMSVDADTWPAYVALPAALLVWWIWNRISPPGRDRD